MGFGFKMNGLIKWNLVLVLFFTVFSHVYADDGYRLWLKHNLVEDPVLREDYSKRMGYIAVEGGGEILKTAVKELQSGLQSMLGITVDSNMQPSFTGGIVVGVAGQSSSVDTLLTKDERAWLGEEAFLLSSRGTMLLIAGGDERGVLYGVFRLLSLMGQNIPFDNLNISEAPAVQLRLLNHWDNLDRTVERGYAGFSIWNWHELPEYIDRRYVDYARANASIGINGSVVTNVNANALVFRKDYIQKTAALADVFRKYGIRIYLTARFSAPIELGILETADPLDPAVREWWSNKVAEIYDLIPDFGGFLVKANSEGQPGPQQYGRTHADGANMLADALRPHGGVVMWRAFVYSDEEPEDRAKQAYNEFVPLDGSFRDNVIVQVKNGPIDFQPREPVHPLFGAMTQTPIMMEFQITKEYLGQGTHLVGLANMYEEILQTDTYTAGKGSTVVRIVDGSLYGNKLTGIAGVSNIGTVRNWTGNYFGQADWYAFGRLAWDPNLSADTIYREWARLSFHKNEKVEEVVTTLLRDSYKYCVEYMTPLGLHHIMAAGHHFGPGPWVSKMSRDDWTSVYYHKADEKGIGFDRTATGSNALEQYGAGFRKVYENPDECPEEFLLWFHHLPWNHRMKSGMTLWEALCRTYHAGADGVREMKRLWQTLEGNVDDETYDHVLMHLLIQEKEAVWWRDACLSYFGSISGLDIPDDLELPEYGLDYYKSLSYPYAPGIRPRW